MKEPFCIGCGASPVFDALGRLIPCACLPEEHLVLLERQAKKHHAEFASARLLTMGDLKRWVGVLQVEDLVRWIRHEGSYKETEFRTTGTALLQLVYFHGRGSKLVRWGLR